MPSHQTRRTRGMSEEVSNHKATKGERREQAVLASS